ncbi:glycosyltransferase [Nocardioides ferulae]|uniref:glycosyltransferase n=1 Tax=Nocardioides ferulae TaxID=2340821 RepID=UPI001981CA16|nr:glycosyltransferase [Nocardioides ferulae]
MTALVVAMVGTDHHPFDRLITWMDDLAFRLGPDVHVVVQHGASTAPLVAEGHAFLSQHELAELLSRADAVVCHGGPGTVMDARNAGHLPICVARDPMRGEHVDGHQQRFVAMAGRTGLVAEARSRADLSRLVDWTLHDAPASDASPPLGVTASGDTPAWACQRLSGELDLLWGSRPTRRSSVGRFLGSRVLR